MWSWEFWGVQSWNWAITSWVYHPLCCIVDPHPDSQGAALMRSHLWSVCLCGIRWRPSVNLLDRTSEDYSYTWAYQGLLHSPEQLSFLALTDLFWFCSHVVFYLNDISPSCCWFDVSVTTCKNCTCNRTRCGDRRAPLRKRRRRRWGSDIILLITNSCKL